jgi:protein ImuA
MRPILQQLRSQVRALEAQGSGAEHQDRTLAIGVDGLDEALGGGLALGGVSELVPTAFMDEPSVLSLGLALASRTMQARGGDLVLLEDGGSGGGHWGRHWGRLYGPGLQSIGIDPARVLIVSVRNTKLAHACLEDCARTTGLAGVVCLLGPKAGFDLVGARRVQLAAEQAHGLVLLVASLHTTPFAPARARLRVAAAPRPGRTVPGASLPLPGPPAWAVTLERTRSGARPQRFELEYDHAYRRITPYHRPAPAPVPNRSAFAGFRQTG